MDYNSMAGELELRERLSPPRLQFDRVQLPRGQYMSGHIVLYCTGVRPLQQIPRNISAQTVRLWSDSSSPEIEPVRIPARKKRWVTSRMPICMKPARLEQELELIVVKMNE